MVHTGYDECSEYTYHDIKDYKTCCTCKYFYDNEKQQRFECLCDSNTNLVCYKNKFEED